MNSTTIRHRHETLFFKSFKIMLYVAFITVITFAVTNILERYFEVSTGNINDEIASVKTLLSKLSDGLSVAESKRDILKQEVDRISEKLPSLSYILPSPMNSEVHLPRHEVSGREYDEQQTDIALESAGGRVVSTYDTKDYERHESSLIRVLHELMTFVCGVSQSARAIIQPGTLPGECWAFQGTRASVLLRLAVRARVRGITLEHIPARIAPTGDISSAPRHLRVEGLETVNSATSVELGSFEYQRAGPPLQYFTVARAPPVAALRIHFLSNWGHPRFTCVYRLRVHADSVPVVEGGPQDKEDL